MESTPRRRWIARAGQTLHSKDTSRGGFVAALCGVAALGVAALTSPPTALAAPTARNPLVETASGPVQGLVNGGVFEFLGIPYAAPPVGPLRWQPPQPPASWTQPRDATAYGNTCPQNNTLGVFARPSTTEDCLYLNVFTPSPAHGRRPVMVWIHGGGLFDGESNDYDGSKLALQGDTVVVTINYRLGVLGWLAQPALDAEGHPFGNYGLMDQQFALQWVRRNIAAFGGDPNDVTIFGESAGGLSVFGNMASPTAAGLFQRAISESGAYALKTTSLATALNDGTGFATAAGCASQTADCLRSLSVEQILANQGSYLAGLMVDGTIVPQSLDVAFSSGAFNRVPVINGSNHDEMRFFVGLPELASGHALTAADYPGAIAAQYGANASQVLAQYPVGNYPSASEALSAAESDSIFVCPAHRADVLLSRWVPVYAYEFNDRTAPSYAPLASFPYGAAHTFEIQYLFPLYHGGLGTPQPLNAAQERLSDEMVQYWTSFARTADPDLSRSWLGELIGDWPPFVPWLDDVQSLQEPFPVTEFNFVQTHNCTFWDALSGS